MKCSNRKPVIVLLAVLISAHTCFSQAGKRPVIVYVTDALCAWCYGANAEMMEVQKYFQNKTDFSVISSGFASNENANTIDVLLPYLVADYTAVESKTGVGFGPDFLNGLLKDDSTHLDSRDCAVALYVFSLYQPENALEFMQCMQHAIFYDGNYPQSDAVFDLCAGQFDMDVEIIRKKMRQDLNVKVTEAQFIIAEDLHVEMLPAVFLQMDGQVLPVSQGFTGREVLIQKIEGYLKNRKPTQFYGGEEN